MVLDETFTSFQKRIAVIQNAVGNLERSGQVGTDWRNVKGACVDLWADCELLDSGHYRYLQHMVQQLGAGVQKLQSDIPKEQEIAIVRQSLELLQCGKVSSEDVHKYEDTWQMLCGGTLPSLPNEYFEVVKEDIRRMRAGSSEN